MELEDDDFAEMVAEVVTHREISISLSNAAHALLNSIIDSRSGSYTSSRSVLLGAYSVAVSIMSISNNGTIRG